MGGMAYPDEPVKSSVVYILVQICSRAPHGVSLPLPLVQSVCRHISTNLASGRSHDLTVNLLGTFGSPNPEQPVSRAEDCVNSLLSQRVSRRETFQTVSLAQKLQYKTLECLVLKFFVQVKTVWNFPHCETLRYSNLLGTVGLA